DWNASVRELLIPGKDDAAVTKKRTRVRLNPLASIANWRCKKIEKQLSGWQVTNRSPSRIING
ncbi:MAG: BglI family type II restriction endonuclease, partial [Chloroflexaceae bacterium]|nr:BglI family type II restriction endonuclease [Chloroflexaceae bacterium]